MRLRGGVGTGLLPNQDLRQVTRLLGDTFDIEITNLLFIYPGIR